MNRALGKWLNYRIVPSITSEDQVVVNYNKHGDAIKAVDRKHSNGNKPVLDIVKLDYYQYVIKPMQNLGYTAARFTNMKFCTGVLQVGTSYIKRLKNTYEIRNYAVKSNRRHYNIGTHTRHY